MYRDFLFALMHLSCVFLYAYTGSIYALYPSIAHMSIVVLIHVFGIGAILSPTYRKRWAEKNPSTEAKDLGASALSQLSMLLCAYQLYSIGFIFLAGMTFVHCFTILVALAVTKIDFTE